MPQGTIFMSETHPEEIRLISYLESPHSDDFADIRRHLITCAVCRKNVMALQTALEDIKHLTPVMAEQSSGEHPDELTLAEYVDGRIPSGQTIKIKQHIAECNFCTKAALHYAMHSADHAQILEEPIHSGGKAEVSHPGFFSRLFSFQMPAWIGVPATALATAVLIFVIISLYNDKEALKTASYQAETEQKVIKVISYQDSPEVVFTPPKGAMPGIGFFGGARKRTEPFGGVEIQPQDEKHFIVRWSEIKTARLYEVRVYSTEKRGRTLIGQTTTSGKTEVSLQVSGMMPGKRYEWELMGQTIDGGGFLTRGGFVVGVEVKF